MAAEFSIPKCWKQPTCSSVNEWIKKLWCIYTMEYYAAERTKELLPFVTARMEALSHLESGMPSLFLHRTSAVRVNLSQLQHTDPTGQDLNQATALGILDIWGWEQVKEVVRG